MNDTTEGQRTPEVRQAYGAAASRYAQEQKLGAKTAEILRARDAAFRTLRSSDPEYAAQRERVNLSALGAVLAAARKSGLLDEEAPCG